MYCLLYTSLPEMYGKNLVFKTGGVDGCDCAEILRLIAAGQIPLSVLDEQCTFDSIKHFGFQSGRDVDKFEGIKMPEDINGIPYRCV